MSQFIEMFGSKKPNARIADVSSVVSGKSIAKELEDIPGDVAYVKVGDFNLPENGKYILASSRYVTSDNADSSKRIPSGTVIFAKNGAASMSNKKRLTAIECCIDMNTLAVIPNPQKLDSEFLYGILDSFDLSSCVRQGAVPSISPHAIEEIEIFIPPFEEQLSFSNLCKQADKSEFVGCKSQFIEMFYGMETTPVKDYIDDSFPGEWGTEDKDGNGVKVIRTTNFTNSGKLNLADVVTRSIEDRKVVRKQIKKYDTILERSGGTADNPVGRVVLFEEDDLFLCNNFTQVLRFKDVDPRFAFYALYYFYQTNRTAIRSMGSKTTGIQNLNMSKYLEIGIPNASDEDQKEFVTIAEQADKSEYYN